MSLNIDNSLWRMKTSDGTPVKLISRKGSINRKSGSATEEYLLRADELLDFLNTAFSPPTISAGSILYPGKAVFYGIPSLVADTVTFEGWDSGKPVDPFGADSDAPEDTYDEFVKCIVQYKPHEPGKAGGGDDSDPNDPTTFLSISSNAAGEFLAPPIPGKAQWYKAVKVGVPGTENLVGFGTYDEYTWVETLQGEVEEANIPATVLSPLTEWSVEWPEIPYNHFYNTILPRLRARIGTVNSVSTALFKNPPPHTILFNGWSTSEVYTWNNSSVNTPPISLSMKFLEKNFMSPDKDYPDTGIQVTHQHIYRPGLGWQLMKIDGHYLYHSTNHNGIWA